MLRVRIAIVASLLIAGFCPNLACADGAIAVGSDADIALWDPGHRRTIDGARIAKAVGALDIGQAVIVQNGIILGIEAIETGNLRVQDARPIIGTEVGAVMLSTPEDWLAHPGSVGRLTPGARAA